MDLGVLIPVTAIAIGPVAWIATTWVRAKHGYTIENEDGTQAGRRDPQAQREIELLSSENERLTGQVSRLEERIAVMERIVTDPADRTAREIEALR
jgi:hypothetical protein